MKVRKVGISEARRQLPALVESIAREGGRIDVTCRGESRVSIVRTTDLDGAQRPTPDALRVEFGFPAEDLIHVLHDARLQWGRPRSVRGVGTSPPKTRRK